MRKLHATQCSLSVHEVRHALYGFGLLLVPDSRVVRRDAAIGLNGAGFDHDQGGTLEGIVAQSRNVAVCQYAGLWPGRSGVVLVHGRNKDTVAESDRADLERLEECWCRTGDFKGLPGESLCIGLKYGILGNVGVGGEVVASC
jgi:hypothetical protein